MTALRQSAIRELEKLRKSGAVIDYSTSEIKAIDPKEYLNL